jgi:hypothetical protein
LRVFLGPASRLFSSKPLGFFLSAPAGFFLGTASCLIFFAASRRGFGAQLCFIPGAQARFFF